MDNFETIFNNLAKKYDPNTLFNEFLDYCIDINLMSLQDRGLNFQGREKYYFELFQEWIKLTNEELNAPKHNVDVNHGNGWYDYLGIFYESTIQSRFNAGHKDDAVRDIDKAIDYCHHLKRHYLEKESEKSSPCEDLRKILMERETGEDNIQKKKTWNSIP